MEDMPNGFTGAIKKASALQGVLYVTESQQALTLNAVQQKYHGACAARWKSLCLYWLDRLYCLASQLSGITQGLDHQQTVTAFVPPDNFLMPAVLLLGDDEYPLAGNNRSL